MPRADAIAEDSDITIRGKGDLTDDDLEEIRSRVNEQLGYADTLVDRGTIWFETEQDRRGSIESLCRIKLVLSGRPMLTAEERAGAPLAAFERALPLVARELEKARMADDVATRKRHRGRGLAKGKPATNTRGSVAGRSRGASYADVGEGSGEIIGRRLGHGPAALKRALARPEKIRRDAYLDTADPAASASERRAGGGSTARRNSRAHPGKSKQVAALEDSRTKPSRKSTRRSATRAKQGTQLERTERGLHFAPSSRSTMANARNSVPRRR
jgi:hypothetical protein